MVRRARNVSLVGGIVALGLTMWWLSTAYGQQGEPLQPPTPVDETHPAEQNMISGCLEVVSRPGEPLVAVVYAPDDKVLGVYHIDQEGGITLKGIRPIRWDLKMLHYNGKRPLPEEVRNGLTR